VDSVGTVSSQAHAKVGQGALVIGALGVVYGDIGTSPLYSFKEAFTEHTHELRVDQINVYGVCSLAFWALHPHHLGQVPLLRDEGRQPR
jgi:KUP system potassium uptake protein